MNRCKFEKRIYLYRELTFDEKKSTDAHIAQCESCRQLATRFFQEQKLIRDFSTRQFASTNPQQLTQGIMNSIERNEKRPIRFDRINSFLDRLFVRYAFGVLSLLLIAFFFIEQRAGDQVPVVAKIEVKQGSILNSNTFLKVLQKRRENKETSISASRYSYNRSERLVTNL